MCHDFYLRFIFTNTINIIENVYLVLNLVPNKPFKDRPNLLLKKSSEEGINYENEIYTDKSILCVIFA